LAAATEGKGSQFLLIYVVAQCLETILAKPIPNKFDVRFKDNRSPFKLAAEWGPILDILLPLSGQLDDAFTKGRVTTEGVKKDGAQLYRGICVHSEPTGGDF
jgi:hypothetical protein